MNVHPANCQTPDNPAQIVPLFGSEAPPEPRKPLRIALVGTFCPRKCGIATFTSDVFEQLGIFHPEIELEIFALDDPAMGLSYPSGCRTITANNPDSFRAAAQTINEAGLDAVWIQHEFGIFGGADGEMIRDFVDSIAAPLLFTFHTVLSRPTVRQQAILEHLISRASRIMVMSQHGRDLLIERHRAPAPIIDVIPHGAPERPFGREAEFKKKLGLSGRKVLMTFGLIGPGKGLEHVIEAMPEVISRHPETIYRIVGATHPNLLAKEGEAYREKLVALARELGVEDHVAWDNRFLETPELLDQLEACDIYLTPYGNLQQATSGTLSYAVALGKAVVSTPYVHARELLADGVGVLIETASRKKLAGAIVSLLDDPAALGEIQRKAYDKGRTTIWPEFASASAGLVRGAVGRRTEDNVASAAAKPALSAVFAMSDSTGMMQHSIGVVPDRRHGYCLDDNVRALMLMNVAEGLRAEDRHARSVTYASFTQHAWNPDRGRFRNFMHFDRRWAEEIGSEDSNGRALWALGHTVERAQDADLRDWAMRWFDETSPALSGLSAPRAKAFAMLGAAAILRGVGRHPQAERILDEGGDLLNRLVESSRRPDWAWFEAVLGYDNPRLSQALIEAGHLRGRGEWTATGIDTLRWIAARQIGAKGYFRPVGSESFGQAYEQMPFDQQPLEAQAAIEAAAAAHAATGDSRWIAHAQAAYGWYFGRNDRHAVLADAASGLCRDGVTPRGINENCGAESILAFQLSYYSLTRLHRAGKIQSVTGEPIERHTRQFGQSASNL